MSVVKLKRDLQQAIANNMMNYKANYNGLIFTDNQEKYSKCFYYMEGMFIKLKDNQLIYDIKLDKEVLSALTEETMERIKETDKKYKVENALLEKMAENNIILEQVYDFNEEKNEEKTYRKATEQEKAKLLTIQQILRQCEIPLQLQESETFLALYGEFKELGLDKKTLLELNFLTKVLDVVAILPQYEDDEESEDVLGIRLFLGINLEE